jgi:hypothetical protein
MRTGSLSVSAYTPRRRHRRRHTSAWLFIVIVVAITTIDVVSAKDSVNLLAIPIISRISSGAGCASTSTPLRVARGGTNDDDAVSNENESTDNMKQPLLSSAHAEATTTTTAAAATTDTSNWRTKLRNVVFPIYGEEMTKFLLIGSIKFFVILALTITRDNKDTMVVTECGAEAIAFLKVSSLPFLHWNSTLFRCESNTTNHSIKSSQDLRSFASSNHVHRYLLKNGKHSRQETTILCHLHPLLCIFLPL